ncbi:hypothetical protein Aduo_006340 [Ancylostoma duodenale]
MDVEVRREYAARIETALRDRGRVAEFFGFDKQRLENDVKEVNNDLSKPLPANVRELLSLADQSLTYYVPTLNKIMTAKPSHVTRRKTLLKLFARIISIPTNTAEVERGFSLYKFLREARRSSTSIINMDTYIRIAVNGPGNPAPYHFNKFMKRGGNSGRKGTGKKYESIFSPSSFYNQFYFSDNDDAPILILD